MSIKERMANFIEDLVTSDAVRVNVGSRTHTATNFFRAAVPALMTGLAVAMSAPAQAEDLSPSLRAAAAGTMYEVLVNGVEAEPIIGMASIAKNQEQALEKYATMQGDTDYLYAGEMVFGDTFNPEAQELVRKNKGFVPADDSLIDARRDVLAKVYCVYGGSVNEELYNNLPGGKKTSPVSQTYSEEGADVAELVVETGYQQLMTKNNVDYFNQRVMSDSGELVSGPRSAAEAFSQQVDAKNIAGWASAIFGVAEGVARITGSEEGVNKARTGRDVADKADRYYSRGKRASKRSGGSSAEAFGKIFRDIGRDVERHRGRETY